MNILRFACGAESPPFSGSFGDWVRENIKAMGGYALGHGKSGTANELKYRVIVFDLNGGVVMPKMPDGSPARCLTCPCAGSAGRKELRGVVMDPRHGQRIIVTCYPSEVSADATRKVASATPDVASATKAVAGRPVRNDQERRSCFVHGDFEGLDCPKCQVRNDPAEHLKCNRHGRFEGVECPRCLTDAIRQAHEEDAVDAER